MQDASGRGGGRRGPCRIKTCTEAKLLFARSLIAGPSNQTPAAEDFRSRAELLFARSARRCRIIPLALPGAVPLNRVGLGDAILLPITGMVDAPLAGAVAADLAVLRIQCQLPDAVLIPALLLTWFCRTRSLLGMKRRRLERAVAETATPLAHSFRIRAPIGIGLGKLNSRRPPLH